MRLEDSIGSKSAIVQVSIFCTVFMPPQALRGGGCYVFAMCPVVLLSQSTE